ncbi:MAG: hypothetical protein AB7E36_12040 [Salinivirgaceae bacterium]
MKKTTIFLLGASFVLLASCVPTYFYQTYTVVPVEKDVVKNNVITYEDANCKIYYNFWDEGGNIGFEFYNKLEENIYLNLDQCFFIFNGLAHDYYKNRIYTHSSSTGTMATRSAYFSVAASGKNNQNLDQTNKTVLGGMAGQSVSSGYSVSSAEEKTICIPPKTSKIISEYLINQELYRDCDLFKYPTKKQVQSKSFSQNDSPMKFSNRLTYQVDGQNEAIVFVNEFFVSEITNYPYSMFFEKEYPEFCEQKGSSMQTYFTKSSPDKFYIQYSKGVDSWKH